MPQSNVLPERGTSNPDKPKLAHNFLVKVDSQEAPFTQSAADFSDKQAKSNGAQIRALKFGLLTRIKHEEALLWQQI